MSETTQTLRKKLVLGNTPAYVLGNGLTPVLVILEALFIIATAVGAGMFYHYLVYDDFGVFGIYLPVGLLAALIYVTLQSVQKHYDVAESFSDTRAFRRIFYLWNAAIFCVLVMGFTAKVSAVYSRGAIFLFYGAGLIGLLLLRAACISFVRHGFLNGWFASKRLLLLGTQERIDWFREQMSLSDYGLHIVGQLRLPRPTDRDPRDAERLEQVLDQAVHRARAARADNIVLLVPWSECEVIKACRHAFQDVPAATVLGLEPGIGRAPDMTLSRIGTSVGLALGRAPMNGLELFLKRAMDLVIASVALVLLAPFLALCALLIKLDSPGPVLFRQYRHGFNEEPFRIYKFRSMSVMEDGDAFVQAVENDPRVTRIGRFMRRWNVDELPQLLNVIKGQMSIVGPRPHPLVHNHDFQQRIVRYARRHNVKPGITGWAQVNGYRGPTETDEKMRGRVDHDLYYIDNWSIWFDIQIVFMTLFSRRAFTNAF